MGMIESTLIYQLSWSKLYATLRQSHNTMLGVSDYSKLWEELGCKEGASLGVSEWGVEGIHVRNMLVTNVRND